MIKLLIFFLILILFGCYDCYQYYTTEVKYREERGTVIRKGLDSTNHGMYTIFLDDNGRTYKLAIFSDVPGLYETTGKGDYILKKKGSLQYKLFKKDTALIFYPVCNGKELK